MLVTVCNADNCDYIEITLIVRPDNPTIVPSAVGETFLLVSTSPHPEQSKRSITLTDPSGVF